MSTAAVPFPSAATALREQVAGWAVPVGLFVLAVIVRVYAAGQVPFAANEGSASYVGAARNIVEGRGFVSDAIWSYATPPLVLPKPAFELWMPMASFLAAIPMALMGSTFAAAQVSSVVLGALVVPLTWWIARQAGQRQGLTDGRTATVAFGSALVAAILGPFLIAAAVPDSTTPFLIFGVGVAIASARMVERPGYLAGLALGVLLGLAYLSRQEAVYLGVAYLLLIAGPLRRSLAAEGLAAAGRMLAAPLVGGLVVVGPWLIRNIAAFGTLFPGQALENVYLSRNEEIFAFLERPTVASFLAQGPSVIVGHILTAIGHNAVSVVLLPALPVGILGVIAAIALHRSPALREPTALRALLVGGLLVFVVTSVLLPVATLWGTFLHAAGPLLVGLTVCALLGLDAAIARIGRVRHWERPNAWLGPLLAVAVAAPFGLLQLDILGRQAADLEARLSSVVAQLEAMPEVASFPTVGPGDAAPGSHAVLISDHPVWLAEALRRPVIALPDEPTASIERLSEQFGTSLLVMLDERGRYPASWLTADTDACLAGPPERLEAPGDDVWLFRIDRGGCQR